LAPPYIIFLNHVLLHFLPFLTHVCFHHFLSRPYTLAEKKGKQSFRREWRAV
jgi:hypothetical protein